MQPNALNTKNNEVFLGDVAEILKRRLGSIPSLQDRKKILQKLRTSFEKGNASELKKLLLLKRDPVNIRTFVESKDFLGLKDEIYPKIMPHIEEINSGKYIEAVLTGGIGVGKTSIAVVTVAYSLYQLSCYESPQTLYGLQQHDEIIFIFQNLNAKLALDVDYARFKAMIDRSPYFKEVFSYDKAYKNEMKFPNRVVVKPVSSSGTAAIGQNVFGGFIDEINFMQVVEKSKQSIDGGMYDQASVAYNALAKRRESRFMSQGAVPGILCLGSSKQYPGQFTDRKVAEAEEQKTKYGRSLIYVYDKRTWDVLPDDRFTGKWFKLFLGDEQRKPRILEGEEEVVEKDKHLVMDVPLEYKHSFEGAGLMDAIRDIAGVSTLAKHPFIMDYEAVSNAFGRHQSILSREDVDFIETQIKFDPKKFFRPELPRWVHLDLAVTGDSAGVAIGCVSEFTKIQRGADVEILPKIHVDAILEVKPPKGAEIQFFKIRALLYKLREHGLNIKWVSADTYQSKDSMQVLRHKGFITGEQSLDTSTIPYDITKTALYDGRVCAPAHARCSKELVQLERDTKKGKIDHPPLGSKDCADALAGVVYGLTMRREIWLSFGVTLVHIPQSIKAIVIKSKDKMEEVKDG